MGLEVGGVAVNDPRPLTTDEATAHATVQAAKDRSAMVRAAIKAWKEDSNSERDLRRTYATKMLWAFFLQTALLNAAFFCMGWGCTKSASAV